jgi:hypothetical protein
MEGYRQPDLHEIIGYGLREGGCLKGLIWLSLSQLISRREVLLVEFPSTIDGKGSKRNREAMGIPWGCPSRKNVWRV